MSCRLTMKPFSSQESEAPERNWATYQGAESQSQATYQSPRSVHDGLGASDNCLASLLSQGRGSHVQHNDAGGTANDKRPARAQQGPGISHHAVRSRSASASSSKRRPKASYIGIKSEAQYQYTRKDPVYNMGQIFSRALPEVLTRQERKIDLPAPRPVSHGGLRHSPTPPKLPESAPAEQRRNQLSTAGPVAICPANHQEFLDEKNRQPTGGDVWSHWLDTIGGPDPGYGFDQDEKRVSTAGSQKYRNFGGNAAWLATVGGPIIDGVLKDPNDAHSFNGPGSNVKRNRSAACGFISHSQTIHGDITKMPGYRPLQQPSKHARRRGFSGPILKKGNILSHFDGWNELNTWKEDSASAEGRAEDKKSISPRGKGTRCWGEPSLKAPWNPYGSWYRRKEPHVDGKWRGYGSQYKQYEPYKNRLRSQSAWGRYEYVQRQDDLRSHLAMVYKPVRPAPGYTGTGSPPEWGQRGFTGSGRLADWEG